MATTKKLNDIKLNGETKMHQSKIKNIKSHIPQHSTKRMKKIVQKKNKKLKKKLAKQMRNNKAPAKAIDELTSGNSNEAFNGIKRKRTENAKDTTNACPTNGKKVKKQVPLTKGKKTTTNNYNSPSSSTSNGTVIKEPIKYAPLELQTDVVHTNSITVGKRALQWLLNPIDVDTFFNTYWERKCLFVRRNQEKLYKHFISCEAIDQMLLKFHVEFTKNIDITSYRDGVRETHNPPGRALPPNVWAFYEEGCSIRLLNPQTFLSPLCAFNAKLQEYFHCFVGVNAYLTPANSQGFAPHYDDIEAFVIQIEGRKRWKLYNSRKTSEVLARTSSTNFQQQEIGAPIFDEVLFPGDLLYFPRGTIHQACTEPGYHSLHLTLSVYQKTSYADLFETMMPMLVHNAIENNVEMREGLPLNIWRENGIAFNGDVTEEGTVIKAEILKRLRKFIVNPRNLNEIIDSAVDQLAKKFQREALPPEILPAERARTIFGARCHINAQGESEPDYKITLTTNLRLLRGNILRLVKEDDEIRLYYYLENSKEYCEYEPNFFEVNPMQATAVEMLIKFYPNYLSVSQFPFNANDYENDDEDEDGDKDDDDSNDDEDCDSKKIAFATALWERGLLMMEKPFKSNENQE